MINKSNKKIVILGYGSIGKRHFRILKKYALLKNIYIFTSQKINMKNSFKNLNKLIDINPDYFIISTITSDHISKIKFIEKNFKNKIILVEKPLFKKYLNYKPKKNLYFVNYNLRFNPALVFLKNYLRRQNFFHAYIKCTSYLPDWRKNTNYIKSYSSSKKLGGGVLLDLSHELDYSNWLFGKSRIISAVNKKISNLNIKSDDYLSVILKNNKKLFINLDINFFSKHTERSITLTGDKQSINIDLINQKINFAGKKFKNITLKKINSDYTYEKTHLSILNSKFQKLCTYDEGIKTMRLIDEIKRKCLK